VIVRLRFATAARAGEPESTTLKESGVAFAAAVGVPRISPVELTSDNPAGNAPLVRVQVSGGVPPTATSLKEYGTPTDPFGSDAVEMPRGPVTVTTAATSGMLRPLARMVAVPGESAFTGITTVVNSLPSG
jgi:hypothetical protein